MSTRAWNACDDRSVRTAENFDLLRFGQALEIYRSATASLWAGLGALTLALVTLLGFGISNQSWGIALTSSLLEPLMLLLINAYARRIRRILEVARRIERQVAGDSWLADAIYLAAPGTVDTTVDPSRGPLLELRRGVLKRRQQTFIAIVGIAHVAVVVYLALGQNWTFAGGSN